MSNIKLSNTKSRAETNGKTEEVQEKVEQLYLPKEVKILMTKRESSDCFRLRVNTKKLNIKYLPGQFFQVSLPGIGEAPISVASFSEDFVDLNIREVGNLTKAASKLKKNDSLFIRGPYGRGYSVDNLFGKNITIIGGGCGAAPLKGMLDYITKNRKDFGEVAVFLGFRTPEDILFKEEIKTWRRNFSVSISVDRNPNSSKIACDVCFVTKIVEKAKLSPENNSALFCGPPVMINALIELLKNKGFQNEQIYLSTERLMHCARGVCGHCMIHGKYTCIDGPVFRYDELCD